MKEREALKLALEASKDLCTEFALTKVQEILTEALAQPEQDSVSMADYMAIVEKYAFLKASQQEQEPYAIETGFDNGDGTYSVRIERLPLRTAPHKDWSKHENLLYTTPPQRTWVGLTGFEQKELMSMSARDAVFATEAKLKEKNT